MRLRTLDHRREYLWRKGYYGESSVGVVGESRYLLSAGTSDHVTIYAELDACEVWAISENSTLGYIGVEVFSEHSEIYDEEEEEYLLPVWDMFAQSPRDLKPTGTPLLEMRGDNVIRFFTEWRY